MPGTLNTTVSRLSESAVDEPDSGAADGPEVSASVQPTTSTRPSSRPSKRFILSFLSINEKNGCGCVANGINKPDSSRNSAFGDRLKGHLHVTQ